MQRKCCNAFANGITDMAETRANRGAAQVSDVLISFVLLFAGLLRTRAHPAEALFAVVSGLLLFSLVEYCFHRWMFHGAVPLFAPGHRRHHENPLGDDAMPFFLPPLALLGIVALVSLAMPGGLAMLLTGGLATGYAIYGLSHDLIHDTRFRNAAGPTLGGQPPCPPLSSGPEFRSHFALVGHRSWHAPRVQARGEIVLDCDEPEADPRCVQPPPSFSAD